MQNMESCRTIEDLEKEYEEVSKGFGLPSFEKLAEDFDVEKVLEKESVFLLRDIRRIIGDKLSAYLHLFETLLNPTSPPMFIFSVLKGMKDDEKKEIREIYQKLAKLQLKTMKLDTIYDEKKEADFVKESFEEWQDMKIKINQLLETFDKEFKEDSNSNKRGYFG
jgi:hypothetical protein